METKHNLLIVEDEKAISNLIATTLETQGYHCLLYTSDAADE